MGKEREKEAKESRGKGAGKDRAGRKGEGRTYNYKDKLWVLLLF